MGLIKEQYINLVKKSKKIKSGKKIYTKSKSYIVFKLDFIKLPDEINIIREIKFRSYIDEEDMCVPTSWCNAISYYVLKNYKKVFKPSQLYLHYFTKKNDGSEGCDPYDCISAIQKYGICSESEYKSKIPTKNNIINGKQNIQNFKYLEIKNNLKEIKKQLYNLNPIIISVDMYSSSYEFTHVLKTPEASDIIEPYGHAMLLVGYNDSTRYFTYLDSDGYHYVEYDYILNKNLTSELFIVNGI